MPLSMRMGLRNLARQPRRTVLTGLMLVVGTALAVWMNGISQGTYAIFIDGATRGMLGHFQLLNGDFNEKPTLFKTIDDAERLLDAMSRVPGVQGVTARVETAGLVALGNRTVGVGLLGVDPVREERTTKLRSMVKRGRWLPPHREASAGEPLPIILGSGVAKRLEADLGSEVSFVGQAADGSIAAELFQVEGILDSDSSELDGALVLVRLSDAQEVLSLGERVHRLIGTVHSTGELAEVFQQLPRPKEYRLASWVELNPGLADSIEADRDSGQIMLWVVMLMAVLGVANAMLMSIFERTREIGIMRALGTSRRQVSSIVLWEVAWLASAGIAVGTGVGAALTSWLVIPLPEPVDFGGVSFDAVTGAHTAFGTLWTPLLIFGACLLAGLWPAQRAARLNPLAALRMS